MSNPNKPDQVLRLIRCKVELAILAVAATSALLELVASAVSLDGARAEQHAAKLELATALMGSPPSDGRPRILIGGEELTMDLSLEGSSPAHEQEERLTPREGALLPRLTPCPRSAPKLEGQTNPAVLEHEAGCLRRVLSS